MRAMGQTLLLALYGLFFACIIGMIVGIMSVLKNRFCRGFALVFVNLIRGVPMIVLAYFIFFGVPYLCNSILKVGTKDFGVAPGTGELSVTERAEYEDEMDTLDRALCEKARQLAARDGLTVSFSESDRFPATVNDDTCIDRVSRAALAVTGAPPIEMAELWRASEDFGWYTKVCPGAIFYIGSGEDYPALHTEGYDFPDAILPAAVQMFRAILTSR